MPSSAAAVASEAARMSAAGSVLDLRMFVPGWLMGHHDCHITTSWCRIICGYPRDLAKSNVNGAPGRTQFATVCAFLAVEPSVLSRKFADKVARFSGGSSRLWQSIQRAANLRCACG